MNINIGINANSFPFNFLIKTCIPVSRAPVELITARKPPKIITNTLTSTASANPKIGDSNTSDNLAPTTPEPFTIVSLTNLAPGNKCEIIPNTNISKIIIVNEDSARLNFFFRFAIFLLSFYFFIIVPV